MKKIILTAIILSLYSAYSNGQDTCRLSYKITTIPFQYLYNDYNLTFEKALTNLRTLGLTLGYRPSTKNEGEIDLPLFGMFGNYTVQNFWNPFENGVTIGLNSKNYFSKYNKRLFYDVHVFYRHWWFDRKNCSYDNVEDEVWSGIRTERQDVYGVKFLFGKSFQLRTKVKIKPVFDFYIGAGLRYKAFKSQLFNVTFQNSVFFPYVEDSFNYWAPSLHLGFRVGIGWGKNI